MKPFQRRYLTAALALVLVGGIPASAADWPIPRGPSREPVPYRYDAAAWDHVPRAFLDDAPACILYAGINYLVEADGTVETITHEIGRINSRKALENLGEYRSIYFHPAYEKLTLNEARVIKADGKLVAVEPRHVQLRDTGTDFQVYDHGKQLVISFPSLEVGDLFEVKWTTRGKNPEHQGHFFKRYTFGADEYPIVCDEMRVRLPSERPLKYAATGGKLEPMIHEEGGQRTYHWKATNRPPLPRDEHLPSKEELRLQVACSTFPSWEAVFRWKKQLRQDCWVCPRELRTLVEEVTRGLPTPLAKAQALTYWVRRHIRYVSVGEKHDYTPHPPAVVLQNRFGDCKDSSQLLAVMLREAGIPVALVSLSVRNDGQILEEVPSPWATHAILLVTINGRPHWIDTTIRLAGWDMLPRDVCDRVCYVVDDEGIQLMRTPAIKPEDNRTEQQTRITIGTDGSTRCERTAIYQGLAALSRRYDWMEVPVGERRRQVTAELQDAHSKTRLRWLHIDEEQLQQNHQPVQARLGYEILDHFGESADHPGQREGSLTDSKVWNNLLWVNLDYERKVPLELEAPFESLHRYIVHLPPYFQLDNGVADKHIRSKWGFFRLTVKEQGDPPWQIDLEFHTRIDQVRVEPDDFEAFRKFHDEVMKAYRVWLTLQPARDAQQAPFLEALYHLMPGDPATAELLAELYLENQQADKARRVLERARSFHPSNARLAELALKAADNLQAEEQILRDVIRHHPQELRYQVTLAANLIDQGRHAEARAILQPVLKKGTAAQKSLGYYQLARSSFLENKLSQALKHFAAAQAADEQTVQTVAAWKFQAGIFEKLNKVQEAREAYRKALQIDGQATAVLEALVRLELAAGNRTQALDYLRRWGIAVGDDSNALARVADYHLRLERYEDAFDYAARSRDLANNSLAQRTLGLVHLHRRDYARAVFHLERAEPDADVLAGLIHSRLAQGQLRQAVQDADQAGKIANPTPALVQACQITLDLVQRRHALLAEAKVPAKQRDAWSEAAERFVCAEHAWANGQTPAAVEALLQGAFAQDVELGPAFGLRGLLALERGRLHLAARDAERAIALSPTQPTGYLVRGRVRLERGQADALGDLKKAAELSQRKDPVILHWLAAALLRDGQKSQALATQREAVQLKPKDRELTDQLLELEKAVKAGAPQP